MTLPQGTFVLRVLDGVVLVSAIRRLTLFALPAIYSLFAWRDEQHDAEPAAA